VRDDELTTIPDTLAELPFFVSGRFPRPDLLGICRAGAVEYTSGRELLVMVRECSLGLAALGLEPGGRVAILSESRPEWVVADLAILAAGGVTVPVYPTVSAEQVAALLADSGATMAVASTPDQAAKVIAAAAQAPALRTLITLDAGAPPTAPFDVRTMADVMAIGHRQIVDGWGVARAFHDRARAVRPDDLATIIYTSGSSGEPKGVMLTHANIVANLRDVQQVLALTDQDVGLSFLPICHAFERTVAYVYLTHGVSCVFAESIDALPANLLQVRPTVMSGVPRVYEKMLDRIYERGRGTRGVRRAVFDLAMRVAAVRGRTIPDGRPMPLWARAAMPLSERLVFSAVRANLGGRVRFTVSGSAPLREDVGRQFFGMGLPILEGYGLTETSPVLTVNRPKHIRFGTVGAPLPSVRIRIADDGEILAAGPNVMRGYFNRPDLTAEAIQDGWFHTGDIGRLEPDGSLRITDRKKELLVTSGGKKVAPQPIEAELRARAVIAEAIVIGDGQRFPAVLVLPRWAALASVAGVAPPATPGEREALAALPAARAAIQQGIDEVNTPLAQFEKLKAFAVVMEDFSIATGELTPTLKVKRRVVESRYARLISAIYASRGPSSAGSM
jgi:long-chain acyl-CoA synthetase